MIKIETPQNWADYEIIDSGQGLKFERFGKYKLIRPEPQALWSSSMPVSAWEQQADAIYQPSKSGNREAGVWEIKNKQLDQKEWTIYYDLAKGVKIQFKLSLSAFKHVGIFPEQAVNWDYLYQSIKAMNQTEVQVLNLFAYTGGASLAARAAGATVTHIDSVKPVLSWARENAEKSGFNQGIKWVAEDALSFAKREHKRAKLYHVIILDPPAYGRGPDGEKWVIEEHLNELIYHCANILAPKGLIVCNLYSLGHSALILQTLLGVHLPNHQVELIELAAKDSYAKFLPLGIIARTKQ